MTRAVVVIGALRLNGRLYILDKQTKQFTIHLDFNGAEGRWTDRNIANATFEGAARELFRVQQPLPSHPLGG